ADLTAEKFLPNPYQVEPGARLYRTGDLARLRADGNLEYLGRVDYQVKIRGYRIELGEVEAELSMHPQVRGCVVIADQDERGERRLVAYLVPEGEGRPSVKELRDYLRERVPEYMVPAWFEHLEQMPLTPNGKANRRGLPRPGQGRGEGDASLQIPRTPI